MQSIKNPVVAKDIQFVHHTHRIAIGGKDLDGDHVDVWPQRQKAKKKKKKVALVVSLVYVQDSSILMVLQASIYFANIIFGMMLEPSSTRPPGNCQRVKIKYTLGVR